MNDRPITVISYNWPDLLDALLASLTVQICTTDPARIALFQGNSGPANAMRCGVS